MSLQTSRRAGIRTVGPTAGPVNGQTARSTGPPTATTTSVSRTGRIGAGTGRRTAEEEVANMDTEADTAPTMGGASAGGTCSKRRVGDVPTTGTDSGWGSKRLSTPPAQLWCRWQNHHVRQRPLRMALHLELLRLPLWNVLRLAMNILRLLLRKMVYLADPNLLRRPRGCQPNFVEREKRWLEFPAACRDKTLRARWFQAVAAHDPLTPY